MTESSGGGAGDDGRFLFKERRLVSADGFVFQLMASKKSKHVCKEKYYWKTHQPLLRK